MSGALKLPGGSEAQTRDGDLLWSAFRKVAGALGLTLPEQAAILGVSRATVGGWKTSPGADPDKLDRMAFFVGIYGLAGQAFPGERGAEGWLRRPNDAALFGGAAPAAWRCLSPGPCGSPTSASARWCWSGTARRPGASADPRSPGSRHVQVEWDDKAGGGRVGCGVGEGQTC